MRRFLCVVLAFMSLISSLAGCSDNTPSSPLPNADSFESFINETVWNVLNIEDNDYKQKLKCSDYEQSDAMYTCNISDIVSYMGTIQDDKVISMTALVSYDALSYLEEQNTQASSFVLALLLIPAAIFDADCATTDDLYAVMEDLQNYPVQNTSENKSYEHIYDNFEYSLDMMAYELFAGYTFQVRYLDENISLSDETIPDLSSENNVPTPEDVSVQPPAEWEEMPLHKCIYCGGIARLTSGAWCCDNCLAVYGEEDFAEKVSLDSFAEGTWWDTYSQRCNLTIDVIDDETIVIEINWSSGASDNTQWIITAKWDGYWGLLRYENGVKQNINEAGTTVGYEDGSGFFYINSGNLYWVDYKESAGFDCIFEFPVY